MALVRRLRQRPHADFFEVALKRRQRGRIEELLDRGHRLADQLVEDLRRLVAAEGRPARDRFVEQDAQRIDVRPVVQRGQPPGMLRTHAGRRAPDLSGRRLREAFLLTGHLREAEIGQVRLVVAVDQDILRLDVAMDDARLVGLVERQSNAADERRLLPDGDSAHPPPAQHRLALDELHGQVALAVDLAGFVDADDVRVLRQAGADARFRQEAAAFGLDLLGVRDRFDVDRLERHLTVQNGIEGLVDDAFPAAADLALDHVLAEGRLGDLAPGLMVGFGGMRRDPRGGAGRRGSLRLLLPGRGGRFWGRGCRLGLLRPGSDGGGSGLGLRGGRSGKRCRLFRRRGHAGDELDVLEERVELGGAQYLLGNEHLAQRPHLLAGAAHAFLLGHRGVELSLGDEAPQDGQLPDG